MLIELESPWQYSLFEKIARVTLILGRMNSFFSRLLISFSLVLSLPFTLSAATYRLVPIDLLPHFEAYTQMNENKNWQMKQACTGPRTPLTRSQENGMVI